MTLDESTVEQSEMSESKAAAYEVAELLEDLCDYAKAFEGPSGTAGYAICARNAASEISGLHKVLKTIRRLTMADGNAESLLNQISDVIDQEISP